MKLKELLRLVFKGPSPQMMAAQLRQPSGLLAKKVGLRMNEVNATLYPATWTALALQDNMRVLEIGFGNGKFFPHLFECAQGLRVSGLDFSEAMLEEATNRNPKLVRNGALHLQLGSSDRMPFADGAFDRLYCINVIYFWEDPAAHLREIARVLAPGGRFAATLRTRTTMERLPFTRYGFRMYEPEEWQGVLEANGFRVLEIRRTQEPEVKFEGHTYTPESAVVVAEKA